jgi:hypothetical protein
VTRSSSKPSEAPSGKGKPTGALAGVHPVDSISRDVRPALGADLTPRSPQLRRHATRTTL